MAAPVGLVGWGASWLRRIRTRIASLISRNPLELAVATILSAQATDKKVNEVTPKVFAQYPTAADYAGADRAELEVTAQADRVLPQQDRLA